jgi:uncharacterized secreted protein with C-terminal beta-propeller domain
VLTVDLDRGLFSVDRDAVMAGAETVYASARSLYVASRRYSRALEAGRLPPGGVTTEIHRFDTSRPDATAYGSSGSVEGFVLNQYALSEHEDVLRVATTSAPDFVADAGPVRESESFVTVLSERAGRLTTTGRVEGLGKGERIFAVRFIGPRGYVVTFRQTDPLYTLDLTDPSRPRVAGELKLLGYSAYLHPVGEGRLLGVGQDATQSGRTQGVQLSLFDVSDAARPTRVAQAELGIDTTSATEFDPHAFLYWAPSSLVVVPVEAFRGGRADAEAVGFRVGPSALTEVGRIAHATPDGPAPVGRSLVVGDALYTLSYAGLGVNRLGDLGRSAFVAFPAPARP